MAKIDFNDEDGVWRTIGGRRVFIREGESLSSAMKKSGKFKSAKRKETKTDHTFKMNDEDKKKYEEVGKKIDDLTKEIDEKNSKESKEDKKEQNKYEGTKRWGFGYANDDNIPVYQNKIDYSGDFTHAKLSKVSDEDLIKIANKQSELYKEASSRQVGDRRTYNGKKDEIFKKTDTLRYENGLKKVNEEMEKRDLPRYNIYNKDNGQIMVSSPTKEMAERQLKDMYETDKSLQKTYNWKKTPEYEIKKGRVDDNLNERKKQNKVETISKAEYDKMPNDYKGTLKELVNTAEFRGENKQDLIKQYEKMGYDVNKDKTILANEKGGTVLKPVKISDSNEKYSVDYFKQRGVEIKDSVPEGYVKLEGATTAPKGYEWYSNGKSRFGGEYKNALVKKEEGSNQITNALRRKAYQKYLKEHPTSKITFDDFKDMRKYIK